MLPTEITVFEKTGGPLTKRIGLRDGEIVNDSSACRMGSGFARRVKIENVQELADLINNFKPSEAYALGRLKDGLPDRVRVVRKEDLNGAGDPHLIARTKNFITFKEGEAGIVLLDFDRKGMSEATAGRMKECGGDFWGALVEVLPDIETVACVERASTSSGLRDTNTGKTFPDSGGRHIVVPVCDAADIPRFLSDLHDRCWLAGFGWGVVSAAGSFLERSIIDKAVGSPERLIFEAAPIIAPPLKQEGRDAKAHDGTVLDTRRLCLPLTDDEKARVRELKGAEERRLLPERQVARAKWATCHIERLVATGMPEAEARATVDRWIDQKELSGAFRLPFDQEDIAGTTVADVLAAPERYIGKTLSDPFEGPSYGRGKAIVYRRDSGSLFIHSFAHGGMNYELKTTPKADAQSRWIWEGEVRVEEARKWLVANLLPETGLALISGQWGAFKTFIALDLASAVMTGSTFIRYPVMRRGGVLLFACEGQNEVAIRIRAAYAARGGGGRAPFAWQETSPRLLDAGATAELVAMIKEAADKMQRDFELPVALVIVDTAGKAAGYTKAGEENDAALAKVIMRTLGLVAIETNTLVTAVAHFGKHVETGTRGSSSYEDDADVVLAALAEKEISGTVSNTRLAARKRRSGCNGEEYPFRTKTSDMGADPDGIPLNTLTIEWLDEAAAGSIQPAKKPDAWAKKSLRLLRQSLMNVLADHGKEVTPWADGPTVRAVDIEVVRTQFYKSYPAAEGTDEKSKTEARRKAFKRAIDDARNANLIGSWEINGVTYLWLVDPMTPQKEMRDETAR